MKLTIILVILLSSIFTQYSPASADSFLLYHQHSISGSDAVSTDTFYRERCFVHVEITITSAHYNQFHRNNPDKTLYPGDAFNYQISTWRDGCSSFHPCPIHTTPNITNIASGNCPAFGSASNSDTAEISPNIREGESIVFSKTAQAQQKVCSKSRTGWHCSYSIVSSTASYIPPMIWPHLIVTMDKDGYELTENDGYTSRNLDKSYYVWDAINLVHNPLYPWKNERVGTIHVDYTKHYLPLNLEDEFVCEFSSCTNTMTITGFQPWTLSFDYGGGNTVYNATSLDLTKNHTITYDTRLINISAQIDQNLNSTDALVVEYEPVYDNYIYPVLSDDQRLAFDDRIGIVLHYFGSESTDKNPDDIIGIHEDRRSKINNYFYSTWGADPWNHTLLDGTRINSTEFSDDIQLDWNEAHDVGIITNESPVKKSEEIKDVLINTEFPNTIPFEVGRHTTANFLKSGYGKIFFDYPGILDVVYDETLKIPRFENATVFDTLQSIYFAGHDITHLTFNDYMYPESFFYNTVAVTAVNSEGIQDNSVQLSLDVTPRLEIPGTQYLDSYMYEKIFYDKKDDGFSQIITGLDKNGNSIPIVNDDDIYPMDENHISGFGSITLEKTRRTGSLFTQYDTILYQNYTDNVMDISEKYLLDSKDARLPIPLTTGLQVLSPFHLTITANDGVKTVTNIFNNTWYDFSVPYKYQVNMNDDNVLNISRDDANPRVLLYKYDPNFGQIMSLKINDVTISGDNLPECFRTISKNTCVISIPQEYLTDGLTISGSNIWNGTANVTLPKLDDHIINPPNKKPESLWVEGLFPEWIAVFLGLPLIILVGFIAYRKYRDKNQQS